MSIMIKGIDMPINCTRCPCCDDETRFCRAANEYIPMLGKPNFCPLMEAEERKTGRWILQGDKNKKLYGWHLCSECGSWIGEPANFCSVCGADMRGEKDELQ